MARMKIWNWLSKGYERMRHVWVERSLKVDGGLDLTGYIDPLTENAGAIGGTNDNDLPVLTATVGADIPAFTDPPSAAEMAALRTFVNALKADNVALRAGTRENAAKINEIIGG